MQMRSDRVATCCISSQWWVHRKDNLFFTPGPRGNPRAPPGDFEYPLGPHLSKGGSGGVKDRYKMLRVYCSVSGIDKVQELR